MAFTTLPTTVFNILSSMSLLQKINEKTQANGQCARIYVHVYVQVQ